jgi:hypothetical protein
MIREGDEIIAIYVHFDGTKDHMLPLLRQYYGTHELARKLVSLGNLSSVDKSADDPPPEHSFDSPVKGYCVAYDRDRHENDEDARSFDSVDEAIKHFRFNDNYFMLPSEQWVHISRDGKISK